MTIHYILDENKNPVEVDLTTWAHWIEDPKRKIVKQETVNGKWISTVFLGLDHGHGGGPPVVFETMIFPTSENGEYQTRCCTWDEAIIMHQKAVNFTMIPHKTGWDEAPSDEIFKDMIKAAREIWNTYDNTHGYVTEKLEVVDMICGDHTMAMKIYRMFDGSNKQKMLDKVNIETKEFIKRNS